MRNARLILCEKNGIWAVALRRELAGTGIRVYETRSRDECRDELAESPASFLGLELTSENIDDVYHFVMVSRDKFPHSRAVVLGLCGTELFECAMREAGVIHATFSPRHLGTVAILVQRHLYARPENGSSLRESIFARLPWGD
jgi:hypothetical protein